MTTARQIISLLKSHVARDDAQFFAVAMQLAVVSEPVDGRIVQLESDAD